jgi:hypothetical protein
MPRAPVMMAIYWCEPIMSKEQKLHKSWWISRKACGSPCANWRKSTDVPLSRKWCGRCKSTCGANGVLRRLIAPDPNRAPPEEPRPTREPHLGAALLLVDLTAAQWATVDAQRRTVRHAYQHAYQVVELDEAGPAAAAGLHPGDVVQINDRHLGSNETVAMRLDEAGIGAKVAISFLRGTELSTMELALTRCYSDTGRDGGSRVLSSPPDPLPVTRGGGEDCGRRYMLARCTVRSRGPSSSTSTMRCHVPSASRRCA